MNFIGFFKTDYHPLSAFANVAVMTTCTVKLLALNLLIKFGDGSISRQDLLRQYNYFHTID